ncbi:MAG TPA: BON domain-containing protein [Albitalea sp.]|nr:BON domain-containing protein [Albitalea sp.]
MSAAMLGGALLAACAMAVPAHADDGAALLLNPFGDPFVRATKGGPCAAPLGPAYTEAQRRAEAHSRIERGTSCWLAGTCSEPNAYRYDHRIADAAVAALRADPALATSTLWVTVQRRFVTLQGCVRDEAQAALAERVAQKVPDVQAVLPTLALPGQAPRYAVAASGPAR